jgi:hypothetical protein
MSASDPFTRQPSVAQKAEILQVLQAVCPFETELLGPTTVENIIAGAEFKPAQGGRHINLMDSITLVSCIAGVAQVVLTLWNPLTPAKRLDTQSAELAEGERRAHAAITAHLAHRPELLQVLANDAQLLEQVVEVVRQLRSTSAEGGGQTS